MFVEPSKAETGGEPMNCPHCRREAQIDWSFCPGCGKSLESASTDSTNPKNSKNQKKANNPQNSSDNKDYSGSYGSSVRQQVLEVIVRQAIAGAPWREICRGPMRVNNISEAEIVAEARARGHDLTESAGERIDNDLSDSEQYSFQPRMKLSERAREAKEKMQALLELNKGRNADFEHCIESLIEQYRELEKEARDYEK